MGGDRTPAGEHSRRSSMPGRRPRARRAAGPGGRALPRPSRSASQPDHREHQVEDDLDRRASTSRRSASAACRASSSARTGRRAAAAPASTRRRPGTSPAAHSSASVPSERHVVGGHDPGRAAHEVAAARATGSLPAAAPRARTRGTAGSPTARRTSRTRRGPRTAASSPTSRGAARPCSAAGRSTRGSRTRSARRCPRRPSSAA